MLSGELLGKRCNKNFIIQNLGYINFIPFHILLIFSNTLIPSSYPLFKTSLDVFIGMFFSSDLHLLSSRFRNNQKSQEAKSGL